MTKMLQCALVASLFALTGCNNKAEVVSPGGGDSMPTTLKANEKLAFSVVGMESPPPGLTTSALLLQPVSANSDATSAH